MAQPPILRFSPEYGGGPLWDDAEGYCLEPAAFGIPDDLAERIRRWDDTYQATLNPDYPPDSRFPDTAAEAVWQAEGEAIFQVLTDLLGADRVRCGPGF